MTTKAKEKMTDIILFDSARKGGTGKSKLAVNSSVILAQKYGKTLLVETDFKNSNYFSTYSNPDVKPKLRFIDYKIVEKENAVKEKAHALNEIKNLEKKASKNDSGRGKALNKIDNLQRKIKEYEKTLDGIECLKVKNSYYWFKDSLNYMIEKEKIRSKIPAELRNQLALQISNTKIIDEFTLEREIERIIDDQVGNAAMKAGILMPHLENYILHTKLDNLDILIGKKNQTDILKDLIENNRALLKESPSEIERILLNDFVIGVRNLSEKYSNIVIDEYASQEELTAPLFELSNKHVIVVDNDIASVKSVRYNLYETISEIFDSMINKNPAALAIASRYNIQTQNKTGIEVYKGILAKAKEINSQMVRYESKKSKNEEIFEGEEESYNLFSKLKYDIALMTGAEGKEKELASLCMVMNKVVPDFLGNMRGRAIGYYNWIKSELEKDGISVYTPGLKKNNDAGIIYFYRNLSDIENKKSQPVTYARPRHNFSVQIKNLVNFIKSGGCVKN